MKTDNRGGDRGDDPDAWLGLSRESRGDGPPDGAGWFRDCRNAAIVLTGWPLGRRGEIGPAAQADSRRAFVLIGLALGLFAAPVAWIAEGLGLTALGAAVFATVAVVVLTNAQAEGGAAAAAADLADIETGSDRRFALIAGCVGAILLARIAGLVALAPLSAMLGALIAAQILSAATMALTALTGAAWAGGEGEGDPPGDPPGDPLYDPLYDGDGSVALWISAAAALLLAILFIGFWTALVAAVVCLVVVAAVWVSADLCGMPRDRNFLYTVRVKTELAVILTVVAVG